MSDTVGRAVDLGPGAACGRTATLPGYELPTAHLLAALLPLLILLGLQRVRARERELLEALDEAMRERDVLNKQRLAELQALGERFAHRVTLPTDALAVVTKQGQLCAHSLDHPAGTRGTSGWGGSPSAPACEGCKRFLDHFSDTK